MGYVSFLSLLWRPPLFELQDQWISMAGVYEMKDKSYLKVKVTPHCFPLALGALNNRIFIAS